MRRTLVLMLLGAMALAGGVAPTWTVSAFVVMLIWLTLGVLIEEVIFRDQSLAVQLEALDLVDDLPVDKREPLLRKISQRQRLPDELRMEATEMLEDDG